MRWTVRSLLIIGALHAFRVSRSHYLYPSEETSCGGVWRPYNVTRTVTALRLRGRNISMAAIVFGHGQLQVPSEYVLPTRRHLRLVIV